VITKNGKAFYSVPATADLLGVPKSKVQDLMGKNILEWDQTHLNGRLIVSLESIRAYRLSRLEVARKK
jgi:hypothetical protein